MSFNNNINCYFNNNSQVQMNVDQVPEISDRVLKIYTENGWTKPTNLASSSLRLQTQVKNLNKMDNFISSSISSKNFSRNKFMSLLILCANIAVISSLIILGISLSPVPVLVGFFLCLMFAYSSYAFSEISTQASKDLYFDNPPSLKPTCPIVSEMVYVFEAFTAEKRLKTERNQRVENLRQSAALLEEILIEESNIRRGIRTQLESSPNLLAEDFDADRVKELRNALKELDKAKAFVSLSNPVE